MLIESKFNNLFPYEIGVFNDFTRDKEHTHTYNITIFRSICFDFWCLVLNCKKKKWSIHSCNYKTYWHFEWMKKTNLSEKIYFVLWPLGWNALKQPSCLMISLAESKPQLATQAGWAWAFFFLFLALIQAYLAVWTNELSPRNHTLPMSELLGSHFDC